MNLFSSALKAARLEAELYATRERLADRDAEIQRLHYRLSHLESLLDQRSAEVLNSVLAHKGMVQVGEEDPSDVEIQHEWAAIDHKVYANWERDFLTANPEMNREEARKLYHKEYGVLLPTQALL